MGGAPFKGASLLCSLSLLSLIRSPSLSFMSPTPASHTPHTRHTAPNQPLALDLFLCCNLSTAPLGPGYLFTAYPDRAVYHHPSPLQAGILLVLLGTWTPVSMFGFKLTTNMQKEQESYTMLQTAHSYLGERADR